MADLTLQALFARAAERVDHRPFCDFRWGFPHGYKLPCTCDRESRLLALCARMAEAAVAAASTTDGGLWPAQVAAGVDAATRVLEGYDG